MSNGNVDLIRRAYEAYSRGDVAAMLQFVDADLEWTYLDPSLEDPEPQVCHGRHELETALEPGRAWSEGGAGGGRRTWRPGDGRGANSGGRRVPHVEG